MGDLRVGPAGILRGDQRLTRVECWFGAWQLDDNANAPRTIESLLPMLRQVTDTTTGVFSLKWIALDR